MDEPEEARHYDLAFGTSSKTYLFKNPNRGISLTSDRISWTLEGKPDSAPYANIASIHLQSGGDWHNAVSHCAITFADRYILTVANSNEAGTAEEESSRIYRNFVYDLHAQLLASKTKRKVRYLAGYQGARYVIILCCTMILGGILVVLPFFLLFRFRSLEILFTLFAGIGLTWPLARMVTNNMPREYAPTSLPEELLP